MDMKQIIALLHQQNFRMTSERKTLLELFLRTEKMYTPAQWYDATKHENLRIGLTTVYRLLEVLTKVGLASPLLVNGNIYYTFCGDHHHHHFICLSCHRVEDLFECPRFESLPEGYRIQQHKVDLFGTCARCSQTNPLANNG